jgi:hypothetical protein
MDYISQSSFSVTLPNLHVGHQCLHNLLPLNEIPRRNTYFRSKKYWLIPLLQQDNQKSATMIAILNSCTRLLVKSIKLHYGVRKFKLTTLRIEYSTFFRNGDRIFYYDVSIIPRLLLNCSTEESLVVWVSS